MKHLRTTLVLATLSVSIVAASQTYARPVPEKRARRSDRRPPTKKVIKFAGKRTRRLPAAPDWVFRPEPTSDPSQRPSPRQALPTASPSKFGNPLRTYTPVPASTPSSDRIVVPVRRLGQPDQPIRLVNGKLLNWNERMISTDEPLLFAMKRAPAGKSASVRCYAHVHAQADDDPTLEVKIGSTTTPHKLPNTMSNGCREGVVEFKLPPGVGNESVRMGAVRADGTDTRWWLELCEWQAD